MHVERTANLLGAAALAVSDLIHAGVATRQGRSASSPAALLVVSSSTGVQVGQLAHRIDLSQPATTRVVDGLEADGLVERRSAGREVEVRITPRGRRVARRLLHSRDAPLVELVETLEEEDRQMLDVVLGKLLATIYERVGDADLLCRLCNREACTASAVCPVGEAERDHGG